MNNDTANQRGAQDTSRTTTPTEPQFKTVDDFANDGDLDMVLTMTIKGMIALCEAHDCQLWRSNGRPKAGRGRQYYITVNNGWRTTPRFRAHTVAEAIEKAQKALAKHLRAENGGAS